MSFSKATLAASAFALLSFVSAHGTVTGIVADGIYHRGYSPSFQFQNPEPVVAGWKIPKDLDNGFVAPSKFADPDIICHVGATNAGTSIPVTAGSKIELQWTAWPESHHGPVIDYLASCNGDCTTVDKTTLSFFKIGEAGLLDNSKAPGSWASDSLISNNNTWVATIPADIAPGNYILRHEIIALHSAGNADGAQNYPQCVNLIVSGSGTAKPAGTLGTKLYTQTDPGILINIYQKLASYVIPGPALYNSGSSAAPATSSIAPVASSSAAAVPTTVAPAPTTTEKTATPIVTPVVTASGSTVTVTPPCSPVVVTVTIEAPTGTVTPSVKVKGAASAARRRHARDMVL